MKNVRAHARILKTLSIIIIILYITYIFIVFLSIMPIGNFSSVRNAIFANVCVLAIMMSGDFNVYRP